VIVRAAPEELAKLRELIARLDVEG